LKTIENIRSTSIFPVLNENIFFCLVSFTGSQLMQTHLDLTYSKQSSMNGKEINAYTRLLLDVLRGDQSTFVRSDELNEAWRIFTPILHQIEKDQIIPTFYSAGSRGPPKADEVMSKIRERCDNYTWKTTAE
jgi:glucose-6-phosphate 1-dehydrogenase